MHGRKLKQLIDKCIDYMLEEESAISDFHRAKTDMERDDAEYLEYYAHSQAYRCAQEIKQAKISKYMAKKYNLELTDIFEYLD